MTSIYPIAVIVKRLDTFGNWRYTGGRVKRNGGAAMSTVTVWGRLTPQERERLEELAKDEDRSLSYVISRILREKLAEQPKRKVLHVTGE